MIRPKKLPRDPMRRAKAIVDLATGESHVEPEPKKNPHAQALAKLGAAKGGAARASKLSKKRRAEIAKAAAAARWSRKIHT